MNNTCPSCGAVYNVAAKDVGRRIKCKKCGSALTVTDSGLEVDGGPAAAPASAPAGDDYDDLGDAPPPRSRSASRRSSGGGMGGLQVDPMQLLKDFGGLWSLLFGFGAFLVIVFMFMPIIGQAHVKSREADVSAATRDHNAYKKRLEKDNQTAKLEEAEKNYEKRREELQDKVDSQRTSNMQSGYWERYFMMFGFVFLMFGSLGWLMPGQSTVRRILGAVVLGAEMVLVFIYFIVRSAAAEVGG